MKRLLWLLIPGASYGQFSIGLGVGYSTAAPVVQLVTNYSVGVAGIRGGYVTHVDNKNPAYFNIEAQVQSKGELYVAPHTGIAYKLQSMDNKDLNGWLWVGGLQVGYKVLKEASVFSDLLYCDKRVIVTIGLKL